MDILPTIASFAEAQIPSDRIIDGVNQSQFFTGVSQKSKRDGFVVYVGEEIYGVKWRNWKMMTKEVSQGAGVGVKINSVPQFYDLHTDPKEMYPMDARI